MLRSWIVPTEPFFADLERMRAEMERLFDLAAPIGNIRGAIRGTFPAVNVGETPENVLVYIFAPGIDPDKLELTLEKGVLTVSGERDTSKEVGENPDPQGYHRRERFSGKFRRVISLPESVDPGKVSAKYSNGILTVTIGKREEEKARKIEVAVE